MPRLPRIDLGSVPRKVRKEELYRQRDDDFILSIVTMAKKRQIRYVTIEASNVY